MALSTCSITLLKAGCARFFTFTHRSDCPPRYVLSPCLLTRPSSPIRQACRIRSRPISPCSNFESDDVNAKRRKCCSFEARQYHAFALRDLRATGPPFIEVNVTDPLALTLCFTLRSAVDHRTNELQGRAH